MWMPYGSEDHLDNTRCGAGWIAMLVFIVLAVVVV